MTIDENLLKTRKHIHFIGIGGSGMFPMVQILHSEGFYITGSDNNETETTKIERKMGIPVTFGQAAENIEGADLIVYTAAIMSDNPELIAAKASGVPVLNAAICSDCSPAAIQRRCALRELTERPPQAP